MIQHFALGNGLCFVLNTDYVVAVMFPMLVLKTTAGYLLKNRTASMAWSCNLLGLLYLLIHLFLPNCGVKVPIVLPS